MKQDTIQKLIRKHKILAEKSDKSLFLIPESEFMRLKKEKEKIDSGKYACAKCLDKKGIPRKILFDGSIETEELLHQPYALWDEIKYWMDRTPANTVLASDERHEKTVQVLNKKGIHCAPAMIIHEICKRHYDRSHTQCGICFNGLLWHYPVDNSHDLYKMEVYYLKRIRLIGIGPTSKSLLKDLAQAFNNRFGLGI